MFERYVRFIVRHRRAVIVATLLLVAAVAPSLRSLHLEIRRRANLPDDHPYVQMQNRISDLFGGEAIVIIGVVATQGDIFTPAILGKVYAHHRPRCATFPASSSRACSAWRRRTSRPSRRRRRRRGRPSAHGRRARPSAEEIARLRDEVRRTASSAATSFRRTRRRPSIVADFDDRLTDAELAARIEQPWSTPSATTSVTIALAGAPDPARGAGGLHGDDRRSSSRSRWW